VFQGASSRSARLILADLLSLLVGLPLRQVALIWTFAPVLVLQGLAVLPQMGQLLHADLHHLRPVAGEG